MDGWVGGWMDGCTEITCADMNVLWGVFVWGFGVLFLSGVCVCVRGCCSPSMCVCVCVCVCDLLIILHVLTSSCPCRWCVLRGLYK